MQIFDPESLMGKMLIDLKDLIKEYNKLVPSKKVYISTWKIRNELSIALCIHYGKRPKNLNEITTENNIIIMWITPSDIKNANIKTNKYNKLNNIRDSLMYDIERLSKNNP